MTEQEITQARADVDQLGIEQLRCGVMLQLLKIEALTKERDECRRQSDLQMNSAIKFCQERNAARIERDELAANHKDCVKCLGEALQDRADLAKAAKLAWLAIVELRYSNSTDKSRSVSEFAVQALREAGVQ